MAKCQCEHIAHVKKDKRTPNGNPGHRYGVDFNTLYITTVKTHYGTFTICRDCERDCIA